jgi:hypothetical protein
MLFARLDRRGPVTDFGDGAIGSDAGGLLLGATDRAIGLVDRFAACLRGGGAPGRWRTSSRRSSGSGCSASRLAEANRVDYVFGLARLPAGRAHRPGARPCRDGRPPLQAARPVLRRLLLVDAHQLEPPASGGGQGGVDGGPRWRRRSALRGHLA